MIPALNVPDSTLDVWREGYTFISRRCDRLGTDGFRTRMMLSPVTCIRGAEAARLFYGDGRFNRDHTFPKSMQHLLQDEGSVQGLHGEAFTHRKGMFVDLLQGPHRGLLDGFAREWQAAVPRWQRRGRVSLLHASEEVLTRAGAAWAGVPLAESEVLPRAAEFSAMLSQVGRVGPPNWWARRLRNRNERWAQDLIRQVRAGTLHPPEGSALAVLASFRGTDGELLDVPVAAVELINVLRPIVSVARFVVYAALALVRYPRWDDAFAAGGDDDLPGFVAEVRRLYPFFPLAGGRVQERLSFDGHEFAPGDWVLLDIYGTNHHPGFWSHPEAFLPERFRGWSPDDYQLVPLGGGEYRNNHRCPGEPMTIPLMTEAVRQLTRGMRWRAGVQDFEITRLFMNPLPRDGMLVQDVQPT